MGGDRGEGWRRKRGREEGYIVGEGELNCAVESDVIL